MGDVADWGPWKEDSFQRFEQDVQIARNFNRFKQDVYSDMFWDQHLKKEEGPRSCGAFPELRLPQGEEAGPLYL